MQLHAEGVLPAQLLPQEDQEGVEGEGGEKKQPRQCTLDCVYKCTLLSYPVVLYCVAIKKQSTFGLITCHTLGLVTIT